ncbi:type I-E CRISPR-associated protein Cse1/CasA [Brachybacterium vulturis]|uniref:Type I-E CRISPR-associated protein Cse1/CasA n=1 Tax=Brachybacterium vulturis TaxID=2017484 RepID=A0A291GKI4_9MICO|nr:type I-E CRISPR-associated protein Cse1/CasA [Brachybacterium vulturis]ATG50698.1 type I-E CRISPR-associated protein Cse1/CasA [Brachybacterium vulturis]
MEDRTSFSLVTEPWIRCQQTDGTDVVLSLEEVFDGTRPVAGLRGDSPTQDYAVLRVLLAVFWRAHRGDAVVAPGRTFDFEDWREGAWHEAVDGEADATVLDYLDQHRDRFDLLHPQHPFMQVADLHTSKDSRPAIARIVPEAESDYFTMRAGEALGSLPFDEATRWLVHTHAYDYSGIKSGAVGDPRVTGGKGYPIGTGWSGMTGGTTILGASLRETLVLNTSPGPLLAGEEDRPVWEREPDGPAERSAPAPKGPADLATWQSRRIRLFREGNRITGVLVSNGDRIPDAGANVFGDPMTPYRFSTNKSSKTQDVFYPRPYDPNRMMWRSLEPLIALDGDVTLARGERSGRRPETLDALARARDEGLAESQSVLSLRLTSASYGPQASSMATTVDARLDVPRRILAPGAGSVRQAVLANAKATLSASVALGVFGGRLLMAAGGEYSFQAAHTDAMLADLEQDFREWLAVLDPDFADASMVEWQQVVETRVRDRANLLLRGAGPKALIGREISQNDRVSLLTAGTAYSRLQRDLRKALPLLPAPQKSTDHSPGTYTFQELTTDE